MKAANSGWSKSTNQLWAYGDTPINEGDLFESEDGGLIRLGCRDLGEYSFFTDLLPLESWVGKTIASVEPITGSRIPFTTGHIIDDLHPGVFVIKFTDETTSTLCADARCMVSVFEDDRAPDFDLLAKAGMVSYQTKQERNDELALNEELSTRRHDLQTQRSIMQLQLLDIATARERKAAYHRIESVEKEIVHINGQLERINWKWVGYVFDLHYMIKWIPSLVNLFGWKDKYNQPFWPVDKMVSPEGLSIKALHKIYDASETTHDSHDVYSLEFEDGTFSVGVSIVENMSVDLPIQELQRVGIISRSQLSEARATFKSAHDIVVSRQGNRDRLHQLHDELKKFGIGHKRTVEILEEIALLEK